ncbi:MAG: hypothetical protein PHQ59_03220 [Candidatus Daviesbacteria bacterium]|nr:hypothetical protein [Candidatus Daviesbacteria bacterium]
MSLELLTNLYPLNNESYLPYLRRGINPPLDIARISTEFLLGDYRERYLSTTYTGDGSLVTSYERDGRKYDGLTISLEEKDGILSVLQIQGARNRISYRLTTGLNINWFSADQIETIGCFLLQSKLAERISFPFLMSGMDHVESENAHERYRVIASLLGLKYSTDEKSYIGKIRSLYGKCKNPCHNCPLI